MIRYDDMRVDRLLIKEYQKQLEVDLKRIQGLDDINVLLSEFEKKFAHYIGTQHAVAVNSGSDALQLSLLASGIGTGDEVIIPNITYPAVPLSVIYTGATPVCVDSKLKDLQIDEGLIEQKITKNTKAIIAAHMFARPCAIDQIITVAKKHDLIVIEDCCQAESSQYQQKKVGSFADLACFSFSYYKPLSSCGGGGGMVCFNDQRYQKVDDCTRVWKDDDCLRTAGQRFAKMYLLDLVAVKVKFKYLKEIIKSRLKAKKVYEQGLSQFDGIKIFVDNELSMSVPQNFVIFSGQRDALGEQLHNKGIQWQKPYKPLHHIDIFKEFCQGTYPVSEQYWNEAIQLPLYSFIKEEDCQEVIDCIKAFKHC